MPSLRIIVASQTFEAPLPDGAVRVGTAPVCDLTLACEGVAAEHCVLEPMPSGEWRLKDLGSGRGTRVNGDEVRQVALKPGDVIEVGAARIEFDPAGAPAPSVAPPAARPAARAALATPAAASAPRPAPSAAPAAAAALPVADVPTTAPEAPRAPATAPSAPTSSASAHHGSAGRKLVGAALLLALVGGVLVAIGLTGKSGGGDDEARGRRDLEAAIGLYRDHDYLGARRALTELSERMRTGEVARQAAIYLTSANQAVSQAEAELDGWATRALDFDLASAASREAVFLERHGQGFAEKVTQALAAVRDEQQRWRRQEVARVAAEVEPLVALSRYTDARARWTKSKASAPIGVDLAADVEAGLAAIDQAADRTADDLLERAATAARLRGPAAGVEVLGVAIEHFEGTAAHGRLAERLTVLEREAKAAKPIAQPTAAPTPGVATGPTPPTPAPTPAAPASAEMLARLEADLTKAVSERAFARAVDLLDQALALAGESPAKAALTERRGDLALARNGLDALAGAITADAKKFGHLELGARLFVAPLSADREGVACAVQGGSTRMRWATMKRELLVQLSERMQPSVQDALPVASLLHELGATEAYERMLVRAGEGGSNPTVLFRLLAHWRGEALPEAGYVAYEGRYVTPEARERLILEARIRGGLDRLAAGREPAARRAAIDELLALGDGARGPLTAALQARREGLVHELVQDKAFSSGKTRQKLWDLLEKRRANALALIEDESAYPYPNPNHQGQAEVERRVDEVREVWERPFRLVAAMDDGVKAALDLVIEVDEALARVKPGYAPDLSQLEELASQAVDMPSYAPAGQAASLREYSLKVLAYNERVATSAIREEKDNVRAVNEYRMMMGRAAVKIEERLVRSARGHSRHMNLNGYFAHEAPAQFPEVRSPGLRAKRQGYGGGVGENIAWGTPTGRDAFRAWFGSSGHHRNMLGRGWTEMGAGRSAPSHWTQNFGALGGRSLSDPDPLPAPAADVAPDPEDAPTQRPDAPMAPRLPDEKPPGQAPDAPSDGGATPGG